jgi:hypothetical protein
MTIIRPTFWGTKPPLTQVRRHTIIDEGQRVMDDKPTINFVGDGVTVTNSDNAIVVDVPGQVGSETHDPDVMIATPNTTFVLGSGAGAGAAGAVTCFQWRQGTASSPGTSMDIPSNTRIRLLQAGWYFVSLVCRADGLDLNSRLMGEIKVNSTGNINNGTRVTLISPPMMPNYGLGIINHTTTVVRKFAANDYLEVFAYTINDTAGGVTINADTSAAATALTVMPMQVGPQGPAGPAGAGGVTSYTHTQGISLATWTITHNLGFFPNVSVVDSANTQVEGDVVYTSVNALTVSFSSAFSGKAYLS